MGKRIATSVLPTNNKHYLTHISDTSKLQKTLDDYDNDELAAYAEELECALQADLEAFADDVFRLSDFEDFGDIEENLQSAALGQDKQEAQDDDIDMSN
jgi:hypothetical protein